GMGLLILALLQRIFLMSSLMLLLVWLIFFMVLIKLLPILGTISGKTVKLMVLALICLGNNRQDSHPPNCMFSCLQILEAFLWFVLIALLNVTLIILTLSVSRLLNLLLRLVAFLLFLNPQCLASISRWITALSSWKRFCLFVCRALSSIMVICMLTAIRLLLTFVMSLYLLLRSLWMNWHNATMCSPNLILITLYTTAPKGTKNGFQRTRRRVRSFAASWLLNALLRIFAMSIITPKRKVLRMSVQDCWRPPL